MLVWMSLSAGTLLPRNLRLHLRLRLPCLVPSALNMIKRMMLPLVAQHPGRTAKLRLLLLLFLLLLLLLDASPKNRAPVLPFEAP